MRNSDRQKDGKKIVRVSDDNLHDPNGITNQLKIGKIFDFIGMRTVSLSKGGYRVQRATDRKA